MAMMTFDEKDRNRCCDAAAGWYSVERPNPGIPANGATLASQIGGRLRAIYAVSPLADEPSALRRLLEELAAKAM